MKSVLLLGGMVSEAVPPSIPSMTGLPLFMSMANSSAGVKGIGGGSPPVPATSLFFLAAAFHKYVIRQF